MGVLYGMTIRDGEPVEGVEIRLVDAAGQPVEELATEADGAFQFELDPGVWKLQWTPPGGDTDEGEIQMTADDQEVEIEI